MDDSRITETLARYDIGIDSFLSVVDTDTGTIRQSVRSSCLPLLNDVSLNINSCEVFLSRSAALIVYDAEYHLIRAYFHASPSLWTFLVAAWNIIASIIAAITFTNEILYAITGYTLANVADKIWPGFQEFWDNLMNKISEISRDLGWGVDGVNHLLNAINAGAETWGIVTGKDRDTIKIEKLDRVQQFSDDLRARLTKWQANPGEMIEWMADQGNAKRFNAGGAVFRMITERIDGVASTTTNLVKSAVRITSELSALQNNMPAIIANNIPQGIFDGLARVDSALNERILPALTGFTDRLDELDAVLVSHRKKAEELADRLAHPGDLLAEIDKLPSYARNNQLVKIDDVTSALMREQNEAAYADMVGDLRNFGLIAAALAAAPAPLAFMELDLPGRSPGITPEPYESWILAADY